MSIFDFTLTAGLALALTAMLLPLQIWRTRMRQPIRPLGPQTHYVKEGTPTGGGLAILLALTLSLLLFAEWPNPELIFLLALMLSFGSIGLIDDALKVKRKSHDGLRAWQKLAMQFIAAGVLLSAFALWQPQMASTGWYLPWIGDWALIDGVFWLSQAVLILVFFANAVNLTDGLDGLVTVPVILCGAALFGVAVFTGASHAGLSLQIVLGLTGAGLAFLWFNRHPAKIFMGDVGSLALGALLAGMAILLKREVFLLLAGGLFVLEAASVIIQVGWFKYSGGQRVFLCAPFHHHLEHMGWRESQVVVRLWFVSAVFLCASLLLATPHLQIGL